MERIADRDCHGRPAHSGGETAYRIVSAGNGCHRSCKNTDAELRADRVDNCSDEKGTEETLRHCAESVNTVAFCGNFDIFPLEKGFKLLHGISSIKH